MMRNPSMVPEPSPQPKPRSLKPKETPELEAVNLEPHALILNPLSLYPGRLQNPTASSKTLLRGCVDCFPIIGFSKAPKPQLPKLANLLIKSLLYLSSLPKKTFPKQQTQDRALSAEPLNPRSRIVEPCGGAEV